MVGHFDLSTGGREYQREYPQFSGTFEFLYLIDNEFIAGLGSIPAPPSNIFNISALQGILRLAKFWPLSCRSERSKVYSEKIDE